MIEDQLKGYQWVGVISWNTQAPNRLKIRVISTTPINEFNYFQPLNSVMGW